MTRIYLDNAATSWPKPESVYRAVETYQRELGAPAGRGGYAQAAEVDRRLQRARVALADLIDAPNSDGVIFTYSGTDSLNLALRSGLLKPRDHVVTTVCEHNSVLRPLRFLEQQEELQVTRVGCDDAGFVPPDEIIKALKPHTRLVVLTHASNVTGAIQPIEEVCRHLRSHAAKILIDAAQTVGHLPISVRNLDCDLLAAPGHKGLLGPAGTGFLYVAPGLETEMTPWRIGGTGTSSESDDPPTEMPAAFEAGNLNVSGLLGLAAGIQFLNDEGIESLRQLQQDLGRELTSQLDAMPHVTRFGPPADDPRRLSVVSFCVDGFAPQEVAVLLEQIAAVQVRAGFHCAPRMHQALKTDTMGGTVRISVGPFNTQHDVGVAVDAIRQLAGAS